MEFPPCHIHPPQTTHTHTAILLHGRASNGAEFAEELFSSVTSNGQTLPDALSTWRWVFPTSRDRLSTRFQEEICSWFDAYSLTDIHERQELQVDGLRESVAYILEILEEEIRLLDGKAHHVYLGGISQGMATALWTLLCAGGGRINGRLGGVVGFCGWLPFAREMEEMTRRSGGASSGSDESQIQRAVCNFCRETVGLAPVSERIVNSQGGVLPPSATPVLLGHGTDDDWVPVELGRQALRVLKGLTGDVEWKEYAGAEGDGHWIKEPQGFDAILEFLERGSRAAEDTVTNACGLVAF
ncbi:Alpha/Beta hydrolase protein [Aspergillus egyptiacus]|nr:Alpha/Beta hydrolase protein [Aspergillus egyptiacus]